MPLQKQQTDVRLGQYRALHSVETELRSIPPSSALAYILKDLQA